MSQSTEMLTATVTALGALVVGVAAWVTLRLSRGDQAGHAPAGPAAPGVVATGYRYCPQEFRTRAAVIHPDGTATCADCRAHIPAMEAPHA